VDARGGAYLPGLVQKPHGDLYRNTCHAVPIHPPEIASVRQRVGVHLRKERT